MDQRQASKGNWEAANSIEAINSGSLQRIADATELMASNYVKLQSERDQYKLWYEQKSKQLRECEKAKSALKGQITKLTKRLG